MNIYKDYDYDEGEYEVGIDNNKFHFSDGPEATAFMFGATACFGIMESAQVQAVDINVLRPLLEELAEGRKINAIKELRGMTGLPLKDAKDALEGVFARLDTPGN